MKKIILLCVILSLTILCFASCEPDTPEEHTHSFGEWETLKEPTCVENGEKVKKCPCGEEQTEVIYATGEHNEAVLHAVEPTCTESGLTEGKYCSECEKVTVEQQTVPARHVLVNGKCENCDYIYHSEGLRYMSNGDGTCYVSNLGGCTDTDIVIPITSPDGDTVTSIGKRAFYGCKSLISIALPETVTSIGERAFYGCESLASIVLPETVTFIDEYAFYGCDSLASIALPDSVIDINWNAFGETALYNDESNWENDVLYIGNHLIEAKDTISGDYTVKQGTLNIALAAFGGCQSLTSVVIPDSVTTIGDYAFSNCTALTSVEIGNGVTTIGKWAFDTCTSLTSVVLPDSVTTISYHAFSNSDKLVSVVIPDSVTYIGDEVFWACYSLASIVIPDSVTYIGSYTFSRCIGLTSVVIPDSVTHIDAGAFSWCESLADVYYTGSEEEWAAISIFVENEILGNVNITYNYVPAE